MNNNIKSQKGITLIALVITIIVLIILATIGIGELSGNGEDINETKDTISLAELNKVQQLVMETYLKYKQLGDSNIITKNGSKLESDEYSSVNNEILTASNNTCHLLLEESNDIEKRYYKLTKADLNSMGLTNINNNDVYIVNYSTGEVFNYSQKKNSSGVLYVHAKNTGN